MWRPAIVRFGAIAFAISCASGRRDATIGNRAGGGQRDLSAAYFCSIHMDRYQYPRFPCVIRKVDGRWMLAKLGGSVRFRGEVRPEGHGLAFDGELYCPWGDCSKPLHGVFQPTGKPGALRGLFADAGVTTLLEPAPDSAFGGAAYGGDGYGGFGYAGAGYGAPHNVRNRAH
jgi:hypothetical protein